MSENITLESAKPCEEDTFKIKLEDLTEESFRPLLNSIFKLKLEDGNAIDVKLTDVNSGKKQREDHECFSLLFQDAAKSSLQQRIYELAHPELGQFSLFLVPVGADDKGHDYEAVFNRIRKTDQ